MYLYILVQNTISKPQRKIRINRISYVQVFVFQEISNFLDSSYSYVKYLELSLSFEMS